MIQNSTLDFLKKIKKNNNRIWFQDNRKLYDSALEDMHQFLTGLIKEGSKADKSLSTLNSKDCLMRIYRDVRFSKNKDPYKSNFGASLSKGGRKSPYAGYYMHIEPNNQSFLAGGMYGPEPEQLQKVRQEIFYNLADFKKIISSKNFKSTFGKLYNEDKLANAPKNFPKDHPDIDLLKYKSYIASHTFTDKEVMDKNFIKNCVKTMKEIKPLLDFLNTTFD